MNPRDLEHDDRSAALKAFDALVHLAKEAGVPDDPRVLKALRVLRSRPGDRQAVQDIYKRVKRWLTSRPAFLARQADRNPFRPYPGPVVSGPLVLGLVYNLFATTPIPFGLHLWEIIQNLLVFGRAGVGKTVVLLLLLANFLREGFPFLVCDFKRDYRHLVRRSAALLVLNWRNFRFNPFAPPPGVDFLYWIQIVADVFFELMFGAVPSAAKSAFLELLVDFSERFAAEHGDGVYPSPHDVVDRIETLLAARNGDGRQKERLRTIQSRLRPACRVLGDMFDCQEGFAIEDLLNEPVVLELDGLSMEIQGFLVSILFFRIFSYRLNNTHRGIPRHALVFDEAKLVFSKERATGSSTISRLVSQGREMGEGLCLADQMPSGLGHAVLANLYTTIGLHLTATQDIQDMAYAMGLDADQRDFMRTQPQGIGIVKMAGRHPQPFLIEIPDFPLKKDVTDEELARHMAPRIARLRFRPRVSGIPAASSSGSAASAAPGGVPSATDVRGATIVPPPPSPEAPASGSPTVLDPASLEFALLVDIRNHPWLAVTERSAALHLTSYKSNRGLRSLERLGLVEAVEIHLGGRGRAIKFFALTEAGQALVGPQNLGPGKGGFEHVFRQRQIRDHFAAQGYETVIEQFVNGKAVDVGLTREGERVAVEIGMSAGHEAENIEKDLRAGWPEVWSYARDAGVRDRIQREWTEREAAFPGAVVRFFLQSDIPK